MINPAADNNVLTNFHPMSKRFMVWDKGLNKFYEDSNGIVSGGGIGWLTEFLNNCGRPAELLEVVQSTNLFDKDGKEIFEGGIIDYDGDGAALGVVVFIDGQWQLKDKYGNLMFLKGAPHQKLIGHILSNLELLEEK